MWIWVGLKGDMGNYVVYRLPQPKGQGCGFPLDLAEEEVVARLLEWYGEMVSLQGHKW